MPAATIARVLNRAQHTLARSRLAVRAAVLVRNQCSCVIKYAFAEGPEFERTGESWLLQRVIGPATAIVDVGANVGDWCQAVLSLDSSKSIVAFEPSPAALRRLTDRFGQMPNVKIVGKALSDQPGTAVFTEERGGGVHSSLIAGCVPDGKSCTVEVSTLDCEMNVAAITHVDVLKIDAEGYDLRVLQGARDLLRRRAIGIIQFEYNRPWRYAGCTLASALQLLQDSGYLPYLLRRDGLYAFDYERYGEFYEYSNFAAVSNESLPLVAAWVRGAI